MTQTSKSGREAAQFGLEAASLIAKELGAKRINPRANEFEMNGERVTVRMAHQNTKDVGVLYAMLDRVQTVIAAFEVAPNEFELRSLSSKDFRADIRDSPTGKGRVGLVRKKVFYEKGNPFGRVKISSVKSKN